MDVLRKGISVPVAGGREPIEFSSEQQFSSVTAQVLLLGRDGWKAWLKFLDKQMVKAIPCDRIGELFSFRISGLTRALRTVVGHKYVKRVEWEESNGPPAFGRVPMDEFGNRTDRPDAMPYGVCVKLQTQQRQAAAQSVAALESKWASQEIPKPQ